MRLARIDSAPLSPLSTAELRAWGLLVVGLAYWGNVVRTARHDDAAGIGLILDSVVQNGAFCLAAWVLAIAGELRDRTAVPASAARIGVTAAACLLSAAASRQATVLALVVLGAQSARSARGGDGARATAALLFALAFEMAWTSTYAMPLHTVAARLDARAVGALLGAFGGGQSVSDNVVASGAADFGIEILVRCASSYPLAGVWLAYVVVLAYLGRVADRRDLRWVAASLAASVALTELRLCWMAAREADFAWLHEGGGATLYTLAATGSAVAFPLLATRAAARGRA